jgi:adenylate cyclase
VAFSDIAGFTRYTHEQGDGAALMLLEQFEQIVHASLPPDGRVVKQLGDGVLMFVPDVAAALGSALEQQRACASIASAESPLWVRTGLHYGSPLVRGDDLIGHDVNLASRVADHALPGEILATADVLEAAPLAEGIRAVEVGPVFVRGVDDAVRLFRIEDQVRR